MSWLSREPAPLEDSTNKKSLPSGIWEKCTNCNEVMLSSEFDENQSVCPICGFHKRLRGKERIEMLIDTDSFFEWDTNVASFDPLTFNDGKSYADKLSILWNKTKRYDAVITGAGLQSGRPVALGVLDFYWMGGSMGTVVGEKIYRLFSRARRLELPVIMVSSSGGARMHEGLLSLMQMAKTCAAVALHKEAGLPFISVLCDPTTGGVAASYAMLGDINFAEPMATIGFAGRRVIETTIRQKLPDDFQTAEFLLDHGMVDRVVKRSELKQMIASVLNILCPTIQ